MATENTIWIVISLDDAAARVRDLLDRGYFAEAKGISEAMKALADRVVSMVSAIGGHAYVILNERQVLEVPMTFAEQLPNVLEGFKAVLGDKLACGMGLTFEEAASAAGKAKSTGQIELYEENDEEDNDRVENDDEFGEVKKGTPRDELPVETLEVPPNLFDPYNQEYKEDATPQIAGEKVTPVAAMSVEEALQSEAKYLQAVGQAMGAPSPEQVQQQMAQMQQQQQQQQQPGDLMEALNGGPVDGHTPEKPGEKKSGEKKEEPKESEEEESEGGEGHEKLGKLLISVKEKLPEIMELQQKNPEAFKNATGLIHKLIALARDRKKVKKAEFSELEELQKAIGSALRLKLPVGAVKNRKRKVLVRGKVHWRSMITGETRGADGEPISIREANVQAKKGTSGNQGG